MLSDFVPILATFRSQWAEESDKGRDSAVVTRAKRNIGVLVNIYLNVFKFT